LFGQARMLARNQGRFAMTQYRGPSFELVDTITWDNLDRSGGFGPRDTPLLSKGAVRAWPAWERWSFDKLADLRKPDGSEVVFRFQNGLVEQGVTRPPLDLKINPYIRELATASPRNVNRGLLPDSQRVR